MANAFENLNARQTETSPLNPDLAADLWKECRPSAGSRAFTEAFMMARDGTIGFVAGAFHGKATAVIGGAVGLAAGFKDGQMAIKAQQFDCVNEKLKLNLDK
jgi:predicted GNAT superfamily acetyltransferase